MISTPFDLSGSPSARSCQASLARIPLPLIIVLVIHWSPVLPGYVSPLPMLYSELSSVSLPNTRFCLQQCWHKWSYNLAVEHSFFFNASYVNMQFYLVNFCIPTLNSSHSFYYDKFHWKTNHWFYYNMKYLLEDRPLKRATYIIIENSESRALSHSEKAKEATGWEVETELPNKNIANNLT